MEKKKIAILNIYQDKIERGVETFIRELARRLSKRHEVDIFSDINYIKLLGGKYDFIVPTNGRFQAILCRLIGWLSGAKIIISGHSGIGLDDRINLYSFPDRFVALSNAAVAWAKKINPFVNVSKIPNGVDIKRFRPIKNKPYSREKITLSVGAFTKEKRHETTIKAVSKLKDVKLIIVGGGGGDREKVGKIGKRLLGKRFQIISLPNAKMPDFYRKADVLAFSSVPWESFGIVMIEAMASGLPVVATDDPIRREIVGEAGLFVDPTDTDAYSKALDKALKMNWGDKRSLAKLGLGKPRKQAEKFSWDKISKQYEELFKSL